MRNGIVNAADAAHILYRLMPLEWLYSLARLQGRLRYRRARVGRVVLDNLANVFGDDLSRQEIDRMGRQFFEYERIRSLLINLVPHMRDDVLEGLFPVEGEAYLDEALARGKGAILLGSHLNSVIMFVALTMWRRRGYAVRVALPEPGDPWAPTLVGRALGTLGGRRETVLEGIGGFYSQFNIRPIVRCLRKNQLIGQTGDGWHSARFVEVEFLGRRLPFTTGFWSIAQMTGAAVIPMFVTGAPPHDTRIILEKPITFQPGAGATAQIDEAIAAYAKRLEHHLLACVPVWQHWLTPQVLDTLTSWPERMLAERYKDVQKDGSEH